MLVDIEYFHRVQMQEYRADIQWSVEAAKFEIQEGTARKDSGLCPRLGMKHTIKSDELCMGWSTEEKNMLKSLNLVHWIMILFLIFRGGNVNFYLRRDWDEIMVLKFLGQFFFFSSNTSLHLNASLSLCVFTEQ